MVRVARVLKLSCLVAVVAGCGRPVIGELGSTAFVHADARYSIAYVEGSSRKLVGSDWKLENARPHDGEQLVYKSGEFPRWELDTDEDGVADAFVQVPSADLRFVHLKHGGVIFLRSIPLDIYEENLALEVLGEHFAEAMSGARWYALNGGSREIGVERRAAVLTERSQVVKVSNVAGRAFTYSFADVDQLHMNPTARVGKMELVLLRPGLAYGMERWSGRRPKTWKAKLMLLVGYWNLPARFEDGYADFEGLLRRLTFVGQAAGLQRGPFEAASRTAAAPGEAAAAVDSKLDPYDDGLPPIPTGREPLEPPAVVGPAPAP